MSPYIDTAACVCAYLVHVQHIQDYSRGLLDMGFLKAQSVLLVISSPLIHGGMLVPCP